MVLSAAILAILEQKVVTVGEEAVVAGLHAIVERKAAKHEPMPVRNDGPCVQDMVIADLEARKAVGIERYGTVLQPFNGRDTLMDLYQEILDAANYIRQLIHERDNAQGLPTPGDRGR
jgi:hypothetical protein